MIPLSYEINFDGIVGPTHNYSGLSFGNTASMANRETASNPLEAALQGVEKMKLLHDLGLKQAVFPPHERPHIPTLRALGFTGKDQSIPEKVFQVNPTILFLYSSASPMWAANALTFTPSIDSGDGKVHITAANMASTRHRIIEAKDTARILKAIFPSNVFFTHHEPLPFGNIFNDEGSANHTRFCKDYSGVGIHFFVYGMRCLAEWAPRPKVYPARQTLEAHEAIIRSHKIFPERTVLAQQSPAAIDAGVFHNDVISVGDRNLLFYHQQAFLNSKAVIDEIRKKAERHLDTEMLFIEVSEKDIPLKNAVASYLFNSQIITNTDQSFSIIAPIECQEDPEVSPYLQRLINNPDIPIKDIHFVNTKESMRNGGGPACLRTRVVLAQNELNAVNPKCLFTDKLYEKLKAWISKHYRETLHPNDLRDPLLLEESQTALNELTGILDLGNIYSFQR